MAKACDGESSTHANKLVELGILLNPVSRTLEPSAFVQIGYQKVQLT